MPIDPESLYLQLGQLIAEMPELGGTGPITPEANRWLGRAVSLVQATGDPRDSALITAACDALGNMMREQNVLLIKSVVYRALARAEAKAPSAARRGFVGVGAALDALQVVAKVLAKAKSDILIVDANLEGKTFTDFAPQATPGVPVRLLTDSATTKSESLAPFATRFVQQYGAQRPLAVRLSPPRALHDRLILVDGGLAWSLTQSLKDFAKCSPALVQKIDAEIAAMKVEHYEQVWAAAIPLDR